MSKQARFASKLPITGMFGGFFVLFGSLSAYCASGILQVYKAL